MTWRPTTFALGELVRRIVDSLLRGPGRGVFLCSRCLVKLATDHLDKSYSAREIARVMEDIFSAPGLIGHMPTSTCAACARTTTPCLGVPTP
jgi:hypothetical protein